MKSAWTFPTLLPTDMHARAHTQVVVVMVVVVAVSSLVTGFGALTHGIRLVGKGR